MTAGGAKPDSDGQWFPNWFWWPLIALGFVVAPFKWLWRKVTGKSD